MKYPYFFQREERREALVLLEPVTPAGVELNAPGKPLSLHQERTPLGWRSQLPTRSRARVPAEVEASTMTSKASTECLVSVTLPGKTEPVAAGQLVLTE